jgi:hypothetical protein
MKIPLRYGLLIACGVMAWVLIARSTVTNPQSLVHTLGGPIFFNVLQFAMIFLGLKALEREKGRPTFKEGIKTGVAISFVYAIAASLFFVGVLAVVGTKWISSQPDAGEVPMAGIAIGAFAGLFFGAMMFGLIYSTLISAFLAKRQSDEQ